MLGFQQQQGHLPCQMQQGLLQLALGGPYHLLLLVLLLLVVVVVALGCSNQSNSLLPIGLLQQ